MDSFNAIIGLWGRGTFGAVALAGDLGISELAVHSWRQRDSIPAKHFAAVIRLAKEKGFTDVTPELLVHLAGRKHTAPSEAA